MRQGDRLLAAHLPRRALPLLLGAAVAPAAAQAWPTRPVRIVVPYGPGGSTDLLARALAERLAALLPGPGFVVENRAGGAAVIGTQAVATAPPDGYTLCLSTNQSHAANPAMIPGLSYRAVEDFAPIARLAEVHHALVVPASGAADWAALRERARAAPIAYASSGVGSASHVIMAALAQREGMRANHVPYRGGAPAVTDTLSGVVDAFVSTLPQVGALVREGRLRALAVGSPQPLPDWPGVPTFAALGLGALAVDAWFGLWAPAGTPDAVLARLEGACLAIVADPAFVGRIEGLGFRPAPLDRAAFGAFQVAEVARWAELVRLTGITGAPG